MASKETNTPQPQRLGAGKTLVLGVQHTFTMFGATVLVPFLTGLDISIALLMAGVGTLIFHLITKGQIPVFLGSSFAFIIPFGAAATMYGVEYALGGIVVAGGIYIIISILIMILGSEKIMRLFPPIVTGPIIMVIGLKLAPNAIDNASENWWLAIFAFAVVVIVNIFFKGFAKILPVLIALGSSYLLAVILTLCGIPLVNFADIQEASWFGLPQFTLAKFDISAILMVAPVAICTMVEHIGDIISVQEITGKDYVKNPGLHRTLLGDGIATTISAMFGGPANTTYSENTGVLALTRVFDPMVMRIAALFAIVLSLIPKFGAVISSIPIAIIGGISIVLFGMIAAVGARTLVENKVDFQAPRNLIIAAVIMVFGLGGASIPVAFGSVNFAVEGMALAAIIGIILNLILPQPNKEKSNNVANNEDNAANDGNE